MKRIIVFVLALFLAMPVMSYAGSVSSRFDLTVGGAANFNFGYFSRTAANDGAIVHGTWGRESRPNATDIQAENGMFRFSPAESTINLLGKGPDVWGAKTSGFVQVDFRGTNTGNAFGAAQIQYAAIRLNWPNAELLVGKFFAQTLDLYSRAFITAGDHTSTSGIGGIRPEQVAFRYNWNKNFNTMIGIIQMTNQEGATGANISYGRTGWPGFQAEIAFQSEACGKIGPDMLKFGLGAVYGKEKKIGNTAAAASASEVTETLDAWVVGLRGLIPIIPEKKGDKTNAMFLSGISYIGQNSWPWLGTPAPGAGSYWRTAQDGNLSLIHI
ncbi:MAG: hypothetical protein N2745_00640, partial [Syntrophorhabdaceae bacterium]|nr:hypothetical protein [Syntrophorhabdaceae bacterium]